jgi:ribosomal protein L3 glutamine methyltransferase
LIPLQCTPWIAEPDAVTDILELCTGSGCLAIMLADAFPDAQVDAVDISSDALKVAQRNLDDYRLNDRIKLIEGDLYSTIGSTQYDMIIANPPYVCADSMSQLPIEYQQEPRIALAGGKDGMELVRQIVADAARYLKPDGILIVEIGNERMHAESAFPNLDLTWVTTSAGDDMVFTVTAKQLRSANTDATHLAKQA